jgi:hypothetical protein
LLYTIGKRKLKFKFYEIDIFKLLLTVDFDDRSISLNRLHLKDSLFFSNLDDLVHNLFGKINLVQKKDPLDYLEF